MSLKKTKKTKAFLGGFIFLMLLLVIPVFPSLAASALKIRYNGKSVDFTGQRVTVQLDQKKLNLGQTPGLELVNSKKEEIYMVPLEDVFRKGMGASYTIKNKSITLKQFNTTIKMTLGSTSATVNGSKVTLPFAPTKVTYVAAKKTKLLVPARFLAEKLGYHYTWKNNSKTSGTIYMTTPFYLIYDNQSHIYTKELSKVTYNKTPIDMSSFGGVVIDGTTFVQASAVFEKSKINASLKYDKKAGTIILSKNGNTIQMTLGSKKAVVNGKGVTMDAAPRIITNGKTKKSFVFVPAQFVATQLGYQYHWNAAARTSEITKKNATYFDWYAGDDFVIPSEQSDFTNATSTETNPVPSQTAVPEEKEPAAAEEAASNLENPDSEPTIEPEPTTEPTAEPTVEPTPEPTEDEEDEAFNYILRITGSYQNGKELITITGYENLDAEFQEENNSIVITIPYTKNAVGNQVYISDDIIHIKKVSVRSTEEETIVTIQIKSGSSYYTEQKGNKINVYFGTETSETPSSDGKIKIAVDCGHGAFTAGKRTPPIPMNLDFNHDGIIDAYKGSQIREHVANVGVGKFLAKELRRCGFDVYESAFGDTDIPLADRQKNIKNAQCDYSVSIHFNAMGDGKTFNQSNGTEVFYYKNPDYAGDSKKFANAVLKEIIKGTPQKNNGINGAHSFAMCKTTAMGTKASILVECAFMTNLHEMQTMMASEAYWKETAQEIAQGICNYTGVSYVPE